jgi:2-methylisocitrate lyase-like PEP mutase family enzyme
MPPIPPEVIATANAKSRRLRELLHSPKILVMPGAYDVLSARLFESMGFPAIQGTSGGIAAIFGLPDEERLGRERTAEVYRQLVAVVDVPVNADGEKGYGGPEGVAETVRQFVAVGLAGMNLEDSAHHGPGEPARLLPLEEHLAKLQAFQEAKRQLGSEFFLNARVDAFATFPSHKEGLDEVIRRGNAYAEAGADCIFIFRPGPAEIIRTIVKEVNAPVSVLAQPDTPSIPELEELGVARVSYGAAFTRAAITAVQQLAQTLLTTGEPASLLHQAMPRDQFLALLREPPDFTPPR